MTRIKSASSTHCLLRPRSMRGIDKSPCGATNLTFNFDTNSNETNLGRAKLVSLMFCLFNSTLTQSISYNCHSITFQPDINRQKSPMLNRRRASITSLARTVPNIVPHSPGATSPVQSPTDMYRYMKNDEPHRQQQRNECSRWVWCVFLKQTHLTSMNLIYRKQICWILSCVYLFHSLLVAPDVRTSAAVDWKLVISSFAVNRQIYSTTTGKQ